MEKMTRIGLSLVLSLGMCISTWIVAPDVVLANNGINVVWDDQNSPNLDAENIFSVDTVLEIKSDFKIESTTDIEAAIKVINGATLTLIIDDNVSLEAIGAKWASGIEVSEGAVLNIEGRGTLIAKGGENGAGIGGTDAGVVNIYGCTIKAEGGYLGAGIGSGILGDIAVNIYDGNITAYGGNGSDIDKNGAAGIGSGTRGNSMVEIYGGTIKAFGGFGNPDGSSSSNGGAGIGSGSGINSTSTISIYGGNITTTAGDRGAGIGSGCFGSSNVVIYDGNIVANGGGWGAGIGSGYNESNSTISIYNGNIKAVSGNGGAGIGSGYLNSEAVITIYGGSINADSIGRGAGIGGGGQSSARVIMYDGNITAKGGNNGAGVGAGENGTNTSLYIDGGIDTTSITAGQDATAIGNGFGSSDVDIIVGIETYSLTVTGSVGGSVYGGGRVPFGEQIDVVVIPDDRYMFKSRVAVNVTDTVNTSMLGAFEKTVFKAELATEAEGSINIVFEWEENLPSGDSSTSNSSPVYVAPGKEVGVVYKPLEEKGTFALTFQGEEIDFLIDKMNKNGNIAIVLTNEEGKNGYIDGLKGAIFEINLKELLEKGGDEVKTITFGLNGNEVQYPVEMLKELVKYSEIVKFKIFEGSLEIGITDENDMVMEYSNYYNPILIRIPYEPLDGENTDYIVMYDKSDLLENIIPRSYYVDGYLYAFVYTGNGYFDIKYVGEQGYSDTVGHWSEDAVKYMSARGVIFGVGNLKFNPYGTVTRGEYITMLMRTFNVTTYGMDNVEPFDDGDKIPDWAKEYAIYAKSIGMSVVDEKGNFNPMEPISREDMFLVTYEAMNLSDMLPEAMTTEFIVFLDGEDVKREAIGAVQTLAKIRLVNGNGDGSLNPKGSSTRAEAAQFLYEFLKYDMKAVNNNDLY